jgi:hypothetical protein
MLAELDAARAQHRGPDVENLLDRIEAIAPTALDFTDKRYAAHIATGQDLLTKGDKVAASQEFTKATSVDPDRVEAKAALAALTPTPTPLPSLPGANRPLSEFLSAILDDVDEFWSAYFVGLGRHYVPARRYVYTGRVNTACGVAVSSVQGPFYCPTDSALYLDASFIQSIRTSAGEFPVASLVAHEVGHHVQRLFGVTKLSGYIEFGHWFSKEIELDADCLSGGEIVKCRGSGWSEGHAA